MDLVRCARLAIPRLQPSSRMAPQSQKMTVKMRRRRRPATRKRTVKRKKRREW